MERKGLHHAALCVKDIDASIAFYEAIGCRLARSWTKDGSRCCMMDLGGNNILEIFSGREDSDEVCPRFVHISFNTDDTDADYAAALAAGARPRTAPKDVTIGGRYPARVAFVFGPDGEVLEFTKEF